MVLTAEEARVLASLMEKETTVPDSYPLTLNALRLACNQTTNRYPLVAYDDRTVDNALMSLKSMGLVRFVHPSHGGRTTRYRHSADERWKLSPGELAVLSVLMLRGPQTVGEVRARAERQHPFTDLSEVEEVLDTFAGRSPEPFAVRLGRRAGERESRWADLMTGAPPAEEPVDEEQRPTRPSEPRTASRDPGALDEVMAELAELRQRVDRLERLVDRTNVSDPTPSEAPSEAE